MAAVISNKYGDGNGGFYVDVGTDVQTNPHTARPIVRVHVTNVYALLAAAGKTDIDAVTIADLVAQAFQ